MNGFKPVLVMAQLQEVGAIITNSHLVYTSGRHGSAYVNKDAVYPHTHLTSGLCREIAGRFVARGIEVVIGPEKGGIILSNNVAFHLETLNTTHDVAEVLAVYAEKTKDGEGFEFNRGYKELAQGRKVLIVEDILTTGGSAKKTVDAAKSIGCDVVGVAVLCNRGGVTAEDLGVPELFSLSDVPLESFAAEECPLCRDGVPVNTTVGKGKEFLANKT